MDLSEPISSLPNTSTVTIKKLNSLGVDNYFDLLNYFPFRYENYSIISKINNAQPGETVTVVGKVIDAKYQITKTGLRIQVFKLEDSSGKIEISFYNQPYLLRLIKVGMTLSVSGTVERFGNKVVIKPKEYEIGPPLKHTGRLVPIYSEKRGLSSKTIRDKIYHLLNSVLLTIKNNSLEFLPKKIISFNGLIDEVSAYRQIHFPNSKENIAKARERLSFDELFTIQLSSLLIKKSWEKEVVGYRFKLNKKYQNLINAFISHLPFKLTQAQIRSWNEILKDLQKKVPMNRFLQGEVGSGKTVVAALSCYFSFLNGYQSLFMAPTEILAQQHYQSLTKLFKNLNLKISLVTSEIKKYQDADIYVGTHALITKKIKINKIGIIIIDEQHRFGVSQRAQLKNKGLNPHLLTMTATPIPRTVALTLYGELDISIIDEMPIGRLPIKTFLVPKNKRLNCYEWIKKQIVKNKSQVFIVCPLIEESETETMKSVKAAKNEFDSLKKTFTNFKLNLLHGKMKSQEKGKVMDEFKNQRFNILVSTPVVEVGVDIPQATIMIVEGADRFGLAQLHQLRGRVGRNDKQSYCFLFTEKDGQEIIKRLTLFSKTSDGNKLAEEDLKTRGPGDIFGTKQHGFINLKIATLSDYLLIDKTKKAVQYFNSHFSLEGYLLLKKRIEKYKVDEVAKD